MRRIRVELALLIAGCEAPASLEGLVGVADLGGGRVATFDRVTGVEVGDAIAATSLPDDVARAEFEPSGAVAWGSELVVTNFRDGVVLAFDLESRTYARTVRRNPTSGASTSARIEEPCAIDLRGDDLLVLGNDSRNLLVLGGDGSVLREIGGDDSEATLRNAHGFALDGSGRLFVGTSPVERDLGLVQVWDLSTGERVGHFAPYGEVEEATAVVLGPDGLLWVADWFGDQVVRFDPDRGERVDVVASSADGVRRPVSLAVDADDVWLLDARGVSRVGAGLVVGTDEADLDWPRGLFLLDDR
jgi:hypothetical protein